MIKLLRWYVCHNQTNTHVELIRKAVADSELDPTAVVKTMRLLKYKTPAVHILVGSGLRNAITNDLCSHARNDLGKYAFLIDEVLTNLYISEVCPMKLYHRIAKAMNVRNQ